jgi:hypothetical protein
LDPPVFELWIKMSYEGIQLNTLLKLQVQLPSAELSLSVPPIRETSDESEGWINKDARGKGGSISKKGVGDDDELVEEIGNSRRSGWRPFS